LEEVPGTENSDNIKGALQPIALRCDYFESEEKCESIENLQSDPIAEKDIEIPSSSMLQFRDGEHSGEATLEEIVEGYDDEELSDHCLIYDEVTESWLTITTYLGREKSTSQDSEECGIDPDDSGDNDVMDTSEDISQKISPVEFEPIEDFQPLSKNDRKKPKRDISAWGKGQVQPLTTKPQGEGSGETDALTPRRKKSKHIKPPAKLMRLCTQAMIQWDMLEDGDRLLLGLSGGKDSMSLLHVLLEFQKKLPVRFEIEVSAHRQYLSR